MRVIIERDSPEHAIVVGDESVVVVDSDAEGEAWQARLVRYAANFCEENVWHLARTRAGRSDVHAVFVTNRTQQVTLWQQRAGDPVIWDYHVVLFDSGDVVDLDTAIEGGPTLPVSVWLKRTFRPAHESLAPRFRLVDAEEFLRTFASDRSHMRGPDGTPRQPFPDWPPIRCPLGAHTLPRFLDMDDDIAGEWLDLSELRHRFTDEPPASR